MQKIEHLNNGQLFGPSKQKDKEFSNIIVT